MASTKQSQTRQVTVTDEQYEQFLHARLDAKHAYENNANEDERAELLVAYNQARAVVRRARKVRKNEAGQLQQLRDAEEAKKAKRSAAAKKAAVTRSAKAARKGGLEGTGGPQPPEQVTIETGAVAEVAA